MIHDNNKDNTFDWSSIIVLKNTQQSMMMMMMMMMICFNLNIFNCQIYTIGLNTIFTTYMKFSAVSYKHRSDRQHDG